VRGGDVKDCGTKLFVENRKLGADNKKLKTQIFDLKEVLQRE
jgi:hypothetical protein